MASRCWVGSCLSNAPRTGIAVLPEYDLAIEFAALRRVRSAVKACDPGHALQALLPRPEAAHARPISKTIGRKRKILAITSSLLYTSPPHLIAMLLTSSEALHSQKNTNIYGQREHQRKRDSTQIPLSAIIKIDNNCAEKKQARRNSSHTMTTYTRLRILQTYKIAHDGCENFTHYFLPISFENFVRQRPHIGPWLELPQFFRHT